MTRIDFPLVGYPLGIKISLVDFKEYFGRVRSFFENEDKKLQEVLSERMKSIPEREHDDFVEAYGLDLHLNQFFFPNVLTESLFLTIFSYLEFSLTSYCPQLENVLKLRVSFSDIKGSGVEKSIIYLKKVVGFNLHGLCVELSYISNIRKLRNLVVHCGGFLPPTKENELNQFISTSKTLNGSPGEKISFERDFIIEFLDILESFFEKLQKSSEEFNKTLPT